MAEATTKIITTPDYLRILDDDKLLTFAVTVDGCETHHQLSILDYPTADTIEKRIAEVAVQVLEELNTNKSADRRKPVSADIQALVDRAVAVESAAAAAAEFVVTKK